MPNPGRQTEKPSSSWKKTFLPTGIFGLFHWMESENHNLGYAHRLPSGVRPSPLTANGSRTSLMSLGLRRYMFDVSGGRLRNCRSPLGVGPNQYGRVVGASSFIALVTK